MRKIATSKTLLVLISIIFTFSVISINKFAYYKYEIRRNSDKSNEFILENAQFWDLTGSPILIDDDDPSKNWSITAETYDWCSGLGTFSSPYIIENVTVDGQNTYNCIRIDNSDVYFMIRNCTSINGLGEYWRSGGIRLENVSNGRIFNNNCSFNQQGIYLINSNNNTLSGNVANNNSIHGIVLHDQCNDTKIIQNSVKFNHDGISIENSYNNLISRNNASNNAARGMDLVYIYDTEIINNTANNNGGYPTVGEGITVQASRNINISFNSIKGNGHGMVIYNDQDIKLFNNSIFSNEEHGVKMARCNNSVLVKNYISNNGWGISISGEGRYICVNGSVTENIMVNNGISLSSCVSYQISKNNFTNSGLGLSGTLAEVSSHTIDITNLVNSKPLYYYTNEVNLGPDDLKNAGEVILVNSNDSLISNLLLPGGIILLYSNNNSISGNKADYDGISLSHSDNNIVLENVANNNFCGIYLHYSNYNDISRNIVNDNTNGIFSRNSNYSTVSGNIANDNQCGIILYDSSHNIISVNTANNNEYGVYLYKSNYNNVSGNTLVGNYICWDEIDCEGNIFENNDCGEGDGQDEDGGIPIEVIVIISVISGGAVIGVATLLLIRRKRKRIQ